MSSQTAISSHEVTILSQGSDKTVGALILQNNYNVKFLPIVIFMNFPEIEYINADGCLIKWVSFDNFVKLSKLKRLSLNSNQIRIIEDGTFKDLKSLEVLNLSESPNTKLPLLALTLMVFREQHD
jgi:Leucine-rich repeat (LRR) protein